MSKEAGGIFKPKVCVQVSIVINLGLTGFKLLAGIVGLSQAMVADALHSFSDILTSIVAYAGICIGKRPADKDHPYGHGNAETIAAILVALVILTIGSYAAYSALSTMIQRHFHKPLTIALLAAVVSIIVKEALFRYTIKVGRISNSPAVVADAWHHRSDAYSSIAALIGIAGAKISFLYLDPLAGLVVSLMIASIAVRLIRSNIGIIMDENPHPDFIDKIKTIVKGVDGIRRVDSIKVHRRGPAFTIDLEVAVDGTITVDRGHQIAVDAKIRLLEQVQNVEEVMVHVNPYRGYPDS